MSNNVSNILTINGTEEQVAKIREFIKGSNGESISFQSFIPMPKNLKGKRNVNVKIGSMTIAIPDDMDWRYQNWGSKWDAMPIEDEAVEAPNRILFNTADETPVAAISHLSEMFPDVSFHVIFSDENEDFYCGEYSISGGAMTNKVWYDVWGEAMDDISNDQVMEYYFLTHEYARKEWKKDEDGEWVRVYEEEDEEA
jgi:hypothetical protein